MNAPSDRACAELLDRTDPLAKMRDAFRIPTRADGSERVYFCGHSLGLQPKTVGRIVQEELDSWAQRAVDGQAEGEVHLRHVEELIACRELIGRAIRGLRPGRLSRGVRGARQEQGRGHQRA